MQKKFMKPYINYANKEVAIQVLKKSMIIIQ
jgi:hypothetical protein